MIDKNITCAELYALQLGHRERYTPVDGKERVRRADKFSSEIRGWIWEKVGSSLNLKSTESCMIEGIGCTEGIYCRYIVRLPQIPKAGKVFPQEVFIHACINRHGLEITFLLWGEDDPDREGDPVRIWTFGSDDDGTTFGMAKQHLRAMLGSRSHKEILNLYK